MQLGGLPAKHSISGSPYAYRDRVLKLDASVRDAHAVLEIFNDSFAGIKFLGPFVDMRLYHDAADSGVASFELRANGIGYNRLCVCVRVRACERACVYDARHFEPFKHRSRRQNVGNGH